MEGWIREWEVCVDSNEHMAPTMHRSQHGNTLAEHTTRLCTCTCTRISSPTDIETDSSEGRVSVRSL